MPYTTTADLTAARVSRFDAVSQPKVATIGHKYGSAQIDMLAIGIALTLAILIRLNIIPSIGF
ncbi:hypothetical protein [Terriglobus saanensis]|uniref:Uncharacterized protein n=1 Tax=Terriglobus saanensis (strain ATCC BAA-1853 / DSM 23119 / SP1PR4) TaxID=401053 RepID=E8V4S0_TERSS|nr:hypothetical protein [Terriglobus saanensis]ADV81474.1 hypothetical protein AciPR4_0640 [Terriglobus saanensis SP1PR4]